MSASLESKGRSRSRLLLIQCPACGCKLRGSAHALRGGMPTCACGEPFEIPEPATLVKVDPERFEELANGLEPRARNDLMRRLGFTDEIVKLDAAGRIKFDGTRSGAKQRRCEWEGGHCMRYIGTGRYCSEHAGTDLPF